MTDVKRMPVSPDNWLPTMETFYAVEMLQEASQMVDWTTEYRQLEAGPLTARTALEERGKISLMREQIDRRLEVVGESPAGMLSVMLPSAGGQLWINGHTLADHELMVLVPGTDIHAASRFPADVVTVNIPLSLFAARATELSPHWPGIRRGEGSPMRAHVKTSAAFRRLILSPQRHVTDTIWETECVSELVAQVVSLIGGSKSLAQTKDRYDRLHKRRILNRSREYIEAHLHGPLCMADICRYAGASLSTLERIFRRELQMPPSAYIQSRRLNAVRHVLIGDGAADKSVTPIAMEHGFRHLGRFSVAYRKYFGQSPSAVHKASGKRLNLSSIG